MKKQKEFPFHNARRITARQVASAHKAIEKKLGVKRPKPGRPPKDFQEKFKPISIRLHPKILRWAKREAKKRGIGYQTVINDVLLKLAA